VEARSCAKARRGKGDTAVKLVDANVILRYLLNDNEEQSPLARQIIEEDCAYTYPEVLAEVVYVLSGVYGLERAEIGDVFRALLKHMYFYDAEMLLTAFNFYEMMNLDFVDCLLVARNLCLSEPVATFDKKVQRLTGRIS